MSTSVGGRAPRYPLDGLRAVAAALVIVFHAYQNNTALPGHEAWTGLAHSVMHSTELAVDLFFAISGFVLWLPIARAVLEQRRMRSGWAMFRARMVRLLPMYVLTFLFIWALANPGIEGGWQDLVLHLTFTQIYSDQYIFWTLGPAWSLAVEFHFYALIALVMPVMGLVAIRVKRRAARVTWLFALPVTLVAVGVLYLLWAIVLDPQPGDRSSVWFSAPSKAADFGVGMVAATVVILGWLPRPAVRVVLAIAAAVIAVVSIGARAALTGEQSQWLHIVFAGVTILVLLSLVPRRMGTPSPVGRAVIFVGTISYSMYLLHEFVMLNLRRLGVLPTGSDPWAVVLTAALVYAVVLVLGFATYRLIEVPAQRFMAFYDEDDRPRQRYAHLEPYIARTPRSLRDGQPVTG